MRTLPFVLAASLLILSPAASGLRADPPAAPVPAAPDKSAPKEMVVSVSVRVVKATPRAARALRLLGTARRPGEASTYDPVALARRLECWTRAGHVNALASPRLLTIPGQTGTVTVGEDVSYVEDYEIEMSMFTWWGNPIIGTVFDGLRMECTADPVPNGVTVHAKLSFSDVVRPIPELETTHPYINTKLRIQLPEVNVRRVKRRLLLPPGRAALLADLPPARDRSGRILMAWIEAHAVADPGR